jgi:hypothetical protein
LAKDLSVQQNFCSRCGSPLTERVEVGTKASQPTPDDLPGDWTDVVAVCRLDSGEEVWLPNARQAGEFHSGDHGSRASEIEPESFVPQKAEFGRLYSDIAEAFKNTFGNPLTIQFGVVGYRL